MLETKAQLSVSLGRLPERPRQASKSRNQQEEDEEEDDVGADGGHTEDRTKKTHEEQEETKRVHELWAGETVLRRIGRIVRVRRVGTVGRSQSRTKGEPE